MNIIRLVVYSFLIIGAVFACKKSADTEQGMPSFNNVGKNKAISDEGTKSKEKAIKITVRIDTKSINKGKSLFEAKCRYCHNAFSTETIVGPGLFGILKNPKLPVSKKPATPENILNQLKEPYNRMPSFSYLPEEDILNIIAFLNTL